MKGTGALASIALHAAVLGTAVAVGARQGATSRDKREIPVFVEIIEAAPEAEALSEAGEVPKGKEGLESPERPVGLEMPERAERPPVPSLAPPVAAMAPEMAPAAPKERAAVVSDPRALGRIEPVYPRLARRKGHEGRVSVEVAVAADGAIDRAEVIGSSGFDELDAAALDAVRGARFAPAMEDGAGVRGRLRLAFDFKLR